MSVSSVIRQGLGSTPSDLVRLGLRSGSPPPAAIGPIITLGLGYSPSAVIRLGLGGASGGTAPGAPSGITNTPTGGTTATITWTAGSPPGTGYEVEIETPSGAANWAPASGTRTGTSFALTGGTPYASARVRVRATEGGLTSAWVNGTEFFFDNTGTGGGTLPQLIPLQAAQSTDAAVNLLLATALQVAEEANAALPLTVVQVLGVAQETNQAPELLFVGQIGVAEETNQAVALPLVLQLQPGNETDEAVELVISAPIVLGVAQEQNRAIPLQSPSTGGGTIDPAAFWGYVLSNGDSVGDNVVAIRTLLETIAGGVNVSRMNGAQIIGDGTEGNPWRGVGVPP